MDRLWSPWRYRYVSTCGGAEGCIFCDKPAAGQDEENLIVYRGQHCYVLLNLYPYTNGHLMIAPFAHEAELDCLRPEAAMEMMALAQQAVAHLKAVYKPHGLNVGMNLGECAGAGVAGHLHLHILPRWVGDANFMTVVGETRVMPEELSETYRKLKAAFGG
ncbi:MAG: HIT domain-containing protein [Bryobacteraceae bacterium]|nr:HIT domain-containing protein [Bryobacteraceae bacterium]